MIWRTVLCFCEACNYGAFKYHGRPKADECPEAFMNEKSNNQKVLYKSGKEILSESRSKNRLLKGAEERKGKEESGAVWKKGLTQMKMGTQENGDTEAQAFSGSCGGILAGDNAANMWRVCL